MRIFKKLRNLQLDSTISSWSIVTINSRFKPKVMLLKHMKSDSRWSVISGSKILRGVTPPLVCNTWELFSEGLISGSFKSLPDYWFSSSIWTLSSSSSIAGRSWFCFFCLRFAPLLELKVSEPTMENVKLVPIPYTDSTEILPPSYSQSYLQIERPTPLLILVFIFSEVYPPNGSNILRRCSFVIPWPLSTTCTCMIVLLSSCLWTSCETVISPTRWYLMAFDKILSKTY